MLDRHLKDWLRTGALLACVAAPASLPATAGQTNDAAPTMQSAEAPLLKRMPASHDRMTLRGESSSAAWPVFLTRGEAGQITTLQLGLLNTVSALPERSQLRVTINGRPVTVLPIRSPDRLTNVAVRIPAGVLVPGFNAVQVDAVMAHRVDCSVKATYELWTLLDPAQTGFVLPRSSLTAGKTLDDLAGETLGPDGTVRIHVRLPDDPNPVTLGRAADLVAAIAARSHLLRAVVDVGSEPGSGPGFDIALDGSAPLEAAGSRAVGHEDGLTLLRDPSSNRLTVVADLTDAASFDTTVETLRRSADRPIEGSTQGLKALSAQTGLATDEDRALTFADLGLGNEVFTGRHLNRTVGVTLPQDFYPGNYGTVRLYIDGDRVAGLTPGSTLTFHVNGALISSLPLGPGSPDRFDRALVNLPLQFFHPGYNAIDIDGVTQTAADDQCTPTTTTPATRLTIADTSEMVLPHLARMQTAPQIASTLQFDHDAPDPSRDIYLTAVDRTSVGLGLTIATAVASHDGAGHFRFNLDQPVASDKPGIVVGPLTSLPEMLASPLRQNFARAPQAEVAAVASPRAKNPAWSGRTTQQMVRTVLAGGTTWLRSRGFFFSNPSDAKQTLAVRDGSLLIADVSTRDKQRTVAGLDLPRFSEQRERWIVVTGASTETMMTAGQALIANDRWKDLAGEAVAYDPSDDTLHRLEASRVSYVLPKTVVLTDVQPILGGIMSSNVLVSVTVLLVLLSFLGLSTHTLLKFLGTRER